jgi:hypothetical protein
VEIQSRIHKIETKEDLFEEQEGNIDFVVSKLAFIPIVGKTSKPIGHFATEFVDKLSELEVGHGFSVTATTAGRFAAYISVIQILTSRKFTSWRVGKKRFKIARVL